MSKVRVERALRVRAQLWTGLLAVVVAAWGLYTSIHQPIFSPAAYPTARPHIAGAAISTQSRAVQPPVDCSLQACLALTFDDGPSAATTPQVLNVLEHHHARATFFVIGSHVPGNEAILRRMYRDGHEIGNHSWSHHDFTTLSPEQIQQEISQTQAAIAAAGVPVPTLFRPPYGAVNQVMRSRVPLTFAMWNVDPEDWRSKDPKEIITKVESRAAPGRVIDLHDIHAQTADGLDQLVGDLQQHYQLVTFSELFNLTSGQPGLFYGR